MADDVDLIIVDLVVGIRSGWDLLEELQRFASTSGIPVIVTSTDQRLLDQIELGIGEVELQRDPGIAALKCDRHFDERTRRRRRGVIGRPLQRERPMSASDVIV